MKKTYRVGILAGAFMLIANVAMACEVNCNLPTGVGKGVKVPTLEVVNCVFGPEGGPYTVIDCKDPAAAHMSPRGDLVVCFLGSDNKIHWDLQSWVHKGRKFFNHKIDGRWQPHWL